MKTAFVFLFLSVVLSLISCHPGSTIYLVRHAEKADSTRDPDLSEAGLARAGRLANLLKDEKIQTIYSTNYKRTIQTATPLSDLIHQPILFYAPDTLPALIKKVWLSNQNTLVVGHSNTTVSALTAFGLAFSGKKIEENDYSNLFKITTYPNSKKLKLKELKF